jgi:hypothetical protein
LTEGANKREGPGSFGNNSRATIEASADAEEIEEPPAKKSSTSKKVTTKKALKKIRK